MATPKSVRSLPTLAPSKLFLPGPRESANQLEGDLVSFWYSARTAIYQAVSALGLAPGHSIALPTFCCGSELDPLLAAGLEPRFYRLTPRLNPEPESFRIAVQDSAAAFVTHYFGFPAELTEVRPMCREAGIPLIEDCAHALYSSRGQEPLGVEADAAIFSIAKTLPVPDGGALRLREPSKAPLPLPRHPPKRLVSRRTRSLLIRHFQTHPVRLVSSLAHLPRALKRLLGLVAAEGRDATQDELAAMILFNREFERVGMSQRSLDLLRRTRHAEVLEARRANYSALIEAIRAVPGIRPVFGELRIGTCPLALPVIADDPADFQRRLTAERGLGVKLMWPWFHPAVPWQEFGFEAGLKRSLFIFPVHQCLTQREMELLLTSLARL